MWRQEQTSATRITPDMVQQSLAASRFLARQAGKARCLTRESLYFSSESGATATGVKREPNHPVAS
jgi:hypothetical protein